MSKGNRDKILFFAGVVVASGVAYLLNTKQGKEVRKNIANTASEYGNKVQEELQSTYSKTSSTINEALNKGKEKLSDLEQEAKTVINKVANNTRKTVNNYHEENEALLN